MRRVLLLSLLVLAAIVPAAGAAPALTLSPPTAHFLRVDNSLWITTAWTPPSRPTEVTVVVQDGSHTLKTLHVKGWLIGTKTFTLRLPKTVSAAALTVQVRATSAAGSAQRSISVPLS